MKAFLKSRKLALFLVLVAAAAMAFAYFSARAVPANYQRAFLPEAELSTAAQTGAQRDATPSNGLREARAAARKMDEQLADTCGATALYAVGEREAVSSVSVTEARSASARLIAMDTSYYALRQPLLYCGRLLYPDELEAGERVVMVDEQLAVALFQYAEPVGQRVKLGEQEYEIVGVVRGGKRVGMQSDYCLYAPYRALEKSALSFTALVYEAQPIPGSGGWVGFESAVSALGATGTTVSLVKERMNAMMPQRMLLCALGFAACAAVLRALMFHVKQFARRYQARLRDQYAVRLLPWLLMRSLGFFLGFAACVGAMAWLFITVVDPVYTFPEWIPAILVEPRDVETAFWNVWHAAANVIEVRTEEVIRLRFLREIAGWSTGLAAFGAGLLLRKRGKGEKGDTEPVEGG